MFVCVGGERLFFFSTISERGEWVIQSQSQHPLGDESKLPEVGSAPGDEHHLGLRRVCSRSALVHTCSVQC